MSTPTDTTMQQQQAAQRAEAMRQAQKLSKPQSSSSVKFAEVLKSQQKPTTSTKLLKQNPVAGAEVVKSAIKGGGNSKSQSKLSAGGANANGSAGATSGSTSGSTGSSTGITDTSATDASIKASYNLMEMNQDFNMQYLNLQESMQAESRQYTAMSNVSKTKTDTAKNSLSNVK